MAIDWDAIFKGALAAGAHAVRDSAPQVRDFLEQVLNGHRQALIELGEARAAGDLTKATFDSELADEEDVLKVELEAVTVLAKAVAQRAINAFSKAFQDGLSAAIKLIV